MPGSEGADCMLDVGALPEIKKLRCIVAVMSKAPRSASLFEPHLSALLGLVQNYSSKGDTGHQDLPNMASLSSDKYAFLRMEGGCILSLARVIDTAY